MKMTTYLQAVILAHGSVMIGETILNYEAEIEAEHGEPRTDLTGAKEYLDKRRRQQIKFYDKVAKLTHAYDAAAERRAAIDPDDQLSLRELEVVKGVADGFSDKEIGALLCISHKTVKSHLVSISGKLRAAGRVDIVITALQRGLIDLPKEKECLPF